MTAIRFEDVSQPIAKLRRRSVLHSARLAAARALAGCRKWRRRAKDRAQLATLSDRMLADIGITRAEARFQSDKPFWRE
jgi:uncharacterized protein YjiS (DUF1127 family)